VKRVRLTPDRMWPASEVGIDARQLRLPSGVRLRVVETGPPDGMPVVLVHGWGCSAYLFSRNVRAIAAAGHRAIALDLVGHGLSDKPIIRGRYTLDAMVGDLFGALDGLAIERAVLVGQSMGGRIALELALRAPERVRALGLFNAVGLARLHVLPLKWLASPRWMAPIFQHCTFRKVFELGLRAAFADSSRITERDIDEYWAPSQFPGFARAAHALLGEFDWARLPDGRLATLRPPTLVLIGLVDHLLRCPDLAVLRSALPSGSHVATVEDAGHAVNEEAPEVVNRELISFLAALPQRSAALAVAELPRAGHTDKGL